jgi:chromosome segregation ATPase
MSQPGIPTVEEQTALVETMRHENEMLKMELTREGREARKTLGKAGSSDISRLQDQSAMYNRKIQEERAKIDVLEKAVSLCQEKIIEQKSRLGGVNAAQVNNQLIKKQVRVLENRLDKHLMKYNEILAQNKELRTQLDEHRRERVVFDLIYKKLEKELYEKKKEMAAIIENSKAAYEERDRAHAELTVLQQNAEKEKVEFESDFRDLGAMIKAKQANLEAMRLQQFERVSEEQQLAHIKESQTSDLSMPMDGLGAKDKIVPLSQEKIRSYEEMLRKIQESTGIYDVNELVTRFNEDEEQNFSRFNYVNEVNSEIEKFEHQISEMRNQLEKYRGLGMSTGTQKKKQSKDLQDRLAKTDKKVEEYETRHQSAVRVITQLKNGIQSIATRIGASSNTDEMLGNQGVTESNMMQYLGIIEQKTTEILHAYAASQLGMSNEQTLQIPSVVPVESAPKMKVEPPSVNDLLQEEDEENDEDARPLTRDEVARKVKKDIAKEFAKKMEERMAIQTSAGTFSPGKTS